MDIPDKDPVTPGSEDTRPNRRELLRKTLTLGTVGYVAPMIVGSVTTVSAQAISGAVVCPQAEPDCATFSCSGGCACVNTVENATVCVVPSCVAACTTTADCPAGTVCFTLGCCGPSTFCVPLIPPGGSCATLTGPWEN